ncbi:MAG: hypothetical protein ACQEP5_04635 [Actinomycetota bacterium]
MDLVLYIKYFFSIASLVTIGYVPVYFLLLNKKILDLEYKNLSGKFFIAFLCFYTGSFIATIFLMVLSLFDISFEFEHIFIFSIVFLCPALYLYFSKRFYYREKIRLKKMIKGTVTLEDDLKIKKGKVVSEERKPRFSFRLSRSSFGTVLFVILAVLTLGSFLAVLFFAFLFPVRFWDAIACWSLKAKAFFIDSDIFTFYTDYRYEFSHHSYPLYLSLLQTWIYIWIGRVDENLVKIIFPLFYLSGLFTLYHFFRGKLNRILSMLFVFVFSAVPIVADHGYIEYANLLFSVVMVLAVYFFYLYRVKRKIGSYLVVSAVFFALLASVRSEGVAYLAIFFMLNLVFLFHDLSRYKHKGRIFINFSYSVLVALLLVSPWYLIAYGLKLPLLSLEWQQFLAQGQAAGIPGLASALRASASQLFFSAYDSTRAFLGSGYGPAWVVLFVLFWVNIKRMFTRANWVPFVFICFGMASVFLSMVFIGDFTGSVERYLLHVFPLAYLWILSNIPNSKRLG